MINPKVNHKSTTTMALLKRASCGFMDNLRKVQFSFRTYIKLILVFLFLYLWDYWTTMMLFFRDENILHLRDYIITLPFNIVLILGFFRLNWLLKVFTLIMMLITTYMYASILLFGKAWEFAVIGLIANFLGTILMLYPHNLAESCQK